MGIAELVIIVAFVVAFILFVGIFAAGVQANRQASQALKIDWQALQDAELQSYLPDQKIHAIKRYRELTDVGLKEAKDAIEYYLAHPDAAEKKGFSGGIIDTEGAGVRDLIAAGKLDEAVRVYADFMGIDTYSAQKAIDAMRGDLAAETNLSMEVADLLAEGNKLEAIKRYRQATGLGLAEAKAAIDRLEAES